MTKVIFTKQAAKSLKKLPQYIVSKLKVWVASVELSGIYEIRKHPGFHDEPLKGERKGERSVRLNNAYRLIYIESNEGEITILMVKEITKHEY